MTEMENSDRPFNVLAHLRQIEDLRNEKKRVAVEAKTVEEALERVLWALEKYGESVDQDQFSHSDSGITVKFEAKTSYRIDPKHRESVMAELDDTGRGHWVMAPRLISSIIEKESAEASFKMPKGIAAYHFVRPTIRSK